MENMYLARKAIRKLPGAIMKTVPTPEPEIIEGHGCRSQIGRVCRESGFDTVLILTDKCLRNLGYLKTIEKSLESESISYKVFDGIITEPRLEYIETGRDIALEIGAKYHIPHGRAIAMCLIPVLQSQMESCTEQLSELARFCNFDSVDDLFNSLESLIALCYLDLDGSIVIPGDFKELSIAIAKDSVNYSAPMTFPGSQIISILSEINKRK